MAQMWKKIKRLFAGEWVTRYCGFRLNART